MYQDKITIGTFQEDQHHVHIASEVDRVYQQVASHVTVEQEKRAIQIQRESLPDVGKLSILSLKSGLESLD
jgi:D-hexose-6-phosphate mutarotase